MYPQICKKAVLGKFCEVRIRKWMSDPTWVLVFTVRLNFAAKAET